MLISGALGQMGRALTELAADQASMEVAAGVDAQAGTRDTPFPCFPTFGILNAARIPQIDVCVDFSHPSTLSSLLGYALRHKLPLVLATTGYIDGDQHRIADASASIPIFQSANMAYGVSVMCQMAASAVSALGNAFDVEILERHHNRKIDAPSGTALMLADAVRAAYPTPKELVYDRHGASRARSPNEIGMAVIRGGTMAGSHEVGFYGDDEIILLQHIAQSRRLFASGALRAARYIVGKPPGLYNMQQLLLENSLVTHLSATRDIAILTIRGVEASPPAMARLFGAIRSINIDMLSQSAPNGGRADVAFSLPQAGLAQAMAAITGLGLTARHRANMVKLMLEGAGIAHAGGVAFKIFDCLASAGVTAHLITTSETKVSLCIDPNQEAVALSALRKMFNL